MGTAQLPIVAGQLPCHVQQERHAAPVQNQAQQRPAQQQLMQAQPDQHQQQAEAQRGASHMCQAGTQAMAGTAAQRNDVDRAGGDRGRKCESGHGQGQAHEGDPFG
ncbi:hypothetical protein O164_13990 [Pseudomonas taiwanensis SJ9]|uniref:Uncharacterized protein n=1 Tax=Pseudomonas taiwanensis SJ9 TaxID=1388762 RepID=V7D9X6_9PSED|nr:hypothetical protein O164_13990 [Pseudomonas taiwanensis SJ9]